MATGTPTRAAIDRNEVEGDGGEGGIRIYRHFEISRNPADSGRTEAIDSTESLDGRTKLARGEGPVGGLEGRSRCPIRRWTVVERG